MCDETQYFTGVGGFDQKSAAFVRSGKTTSTYVRFDGTERAGGTMYRLEQALEYVAQGKWKKITREDALAMLDKPGPAVLDETCRIIRDTVTEAIADTFAKAWNSPADSFGNPTPCAKCARLNAIIETLRAEIRQMSEHMDFN